MNKAYIDQVKNKFVAQFGATPKLLVASPGRINFLGEHTDYNDGLVLPAAVDKMMYFAISPSETTTVNAYSYDLDESVSFDMATALSAGDKTWANYIMGVVEGLKAQGGLTKGFDCVFGGDIPIGSGMSSSAALEGGIGTGLNELYQLGLDKMTLAKIGQSAEHNYVGVKCGLMDQFANLFGQDNQAVMMDCRDQSYKYHTAKFDEEFILLFDTQVKHSLGDSEYNKRREECEGGVAILQKYYEGITSLRDVTIEQLDKHREELGELVYKRCAYVVEENTRVLKACEAMDQQDYVRLGEIMYDTHEGLSTSYEVSCPELDFLVDSGKNYDNILGSRMMGGGFGGCTINLVKRADHESMVEEIGAAYKKQFGKEMKVYAINISKGASVVS